MDENLVIMNRTTWFRMLVLAPIVPGVLLGGFWWMCLRMPGSSYRGKLRSFSGQERERKERIERTVRKLSEDIGDRNAANAYSGLQRAENYLVDTFRGYGYQVRRQSYKALGKEVANLVVEKKGQSRPEEIVVVGAHYDTAGNPGADDNASAVATLLELARFFADRSPDRTLRFVAFVNEETGFLPVDEMGSDHYAKQAKSRNENIVAMISLEMLGYYSTEPGSQKYPYSFFQYLFPDRANFLAFVGNFDSAGLVRTSIGAFRDRVKFPSEGVALPTLFSNIARSDHSSFWDRGYPAIMVTDTSNFRNPHYHQQTDTLNTLDFERLTRVTTGMIQVVQELINRSSP